MFLKDDGVVCLLAAFIFALGGVRFDESGCLDSEAPVKYLFQGMYTICWGGCEWYELCGTNKGPRSKFLYSYTATIYVVNSMIIDPSFPIDARCSDAASQEEVHDLTAINECL